MRIEQPRWRRRALVALLILGFGVCLPSWAVAYVGPGAGIAFMTTALALLSTIAVVFLGAIIWPIRWVYLAITRRKPPNPPRIQRMVIIGLDGIDPNLVEEMIERGDLPNMARIAEQGSFSRLGTTYPAMSPVAWSSFSTGSNPGRHGIYDFLTRDPRSYMPDLSSAQVRPPARHLDIGKWRIPLSKPRVRLLRRSKPFWTILGDYRVPCSILRVPVTFPPDRFEGMMLSAMCVPDMQGSQGTFTHLVEAADASQVDGEGEADDAEESEIQDPYAVGMTRKIHFDEQGIGRVTLRGPDNPLRSDRQELTTDILIRREREAGRVIVEMSGERVVLTPGVYSDWLEVAFPLGLGLKMRGICRMRVIDFDPLRIYVSPINIDPGRPVLPISHPRIFSVFLSKLLGPFATLGLAEDTWALNEGVLDDEGFLDQAWLNHAEREGMLFEMLGRTPKGLVTCVFDGTDRIQHMFWRYRDEDHPAVEDPALRERYRGVIEQTYQRCDEMLGEVLEQVDITSGKEAMIVMSDHGFASFRRGINLNTWLHANGYLVLEQGRDASGEWFRGVDWTKTRAFALGLGGIFLNIRGREEHGIVEPGQPARELAEQLADELRGLKDPATDEVAIREVYAAHDIYEGPYVDDAPSVIIGYERGWRISWDGARGKVTDVIFDDNTKAWSGDHCIDPVQVPGTLISSLPLDLPEPDGGQLPSIMDVAPTVLELFGVKPPAYMDGTSRAGDEEARG